MVGNEVFERLAECEHPFVSTVFCPCCGENMVAPSRVSVSPGGAGMCGVVSVDYSGVSIDKRSDGRQGRGVRIELLFECENMDCDDFVLSFHFHKGATYFHRLVTAGRRDDGVIWRD